MRFELKLTELEYQRLKQIAQDDDRSMGGCIRRLIKDAWAARELILRDLARRKDSVGKAHHSVLKDLWGTATPGVRPHKRRRGKK